jgi:hypothetical protein
MSDSALIGMLVIALGAHVALARVNRWLGAVREHVRGGRTAALLTNIATTAAVAGWGALALGLVLDAVHVHALSTVFAAIVVVMIPLALLSLSASLLLRFVARAGGLRPAARRAYHYTWQFIRAVIPLLGAMLLALVSFCLRVAGEIAEGILRSADEPGQDRNEDKRPAIGTYYNYRTGQYDDRSDPDGIYHDKPDRRYCLF